MNFFIKQRDLIMYNLKIGDIVTHFEHTNITGTITELLTIDVDNGDPVHQLDPNNPWYHIKWNDPEGQWIGFEHDQSLIKQ